MRVSACVASHPAPVADVGVHIDGLHRARLTHAPTNPLV